MRRAALLAVCAMAVAGGVAVWVLARERGETARGTPVPAIEPGSRYFDTGELVEPPWRTLHLCPRCASRIWA